MSERDDGEGERPSEWDPGDEDADTDAPDRGGDSTPSTGDGPSRSSRPSVGGTGGGDGEGPEAGDSGGGTDPDGAFLTDLLGSVFAVLCVGFLLFAVSGVWPPMVAIESPSMEDNINTNDLVFVMDNDRFPSEHQTRDTGVVTAYTGQEVGYTTFNLPGDVIVFEPDGRSNSVPIIHRSVFWVNESENWYPKTQERFLPGGVDSCEELPSCPAPNEGFITLGDNNPTYDQAGGPVSRPVKPEWVIGTAEFRIPRLGWLRLQAATTGPVVLSDPVPVDPVGHTANTPRAAG